MKKPKVACVPVEPTNVLMPRYPVGTGYTKITCPSCDKLMWIGPTSRELLEAGRADAECMMCLADSGELATARLTSMDSLGIGPGVKQ